MSKGKDSARCNIPKARTANHSTAGKAGGSGEYKTIHRFGESP